MADKTGHINYLIEDFGVEILERPDGDCRSHCSFYEHCAFKRDRSDKLFKACNRLRLEGLADKPHFLKIKKPGAKADTVAAALEAAMDMTEVHE